MSFVDTRKREKNKTRSSIESLRRTSRHIIVKNDVMWIYTIDNETHKKSATQGFNLECFSGKQIPQLTSGSCFCPDFETTTSPKTDSGKTDKLGAYPLGRQFFQTKFMSFPKRTLMSPFGSQTNKARLRCLGRVASPWET